MPRPPLVFMEASSHNSPLWRIVYGVYIMSTTTNFTMYVRTPPASLTSYTNSFWIVQ
jgi:hypothetical protein